MPGNLSGPPDLSNIRRRKGISLSDIATQTKIGVNYLQAIEAGEFTKLPGGVYSISYVRQYARAIDWDEHELVEYYYRKTGLSPEPAAADERKAAPPRKPFSQIFRIATPLFRFLRI